MKRDLSANELAKTTDNGDDGDDAVAVETKKSAKKSARRSWEDEINDTTGKWERSKSSFQEIISETHPIYKPESGRYHLYLAKACPWATRIDILLNLLGMTNDITITYVDPVFDTIGENRTGWVFTDKFPDTLNNCTTLYEVYLKYHPNYQGKATTPMLLDKKTSTIVSNESRDMLKSLCWGCKSFHKNIPTNVDYYPNDETTVKTIDMWIDTLYDPLLNGVYKVGFAKTQIEYDTCIRDMFTMLDQLDDHLSEHKWMLGQQFSVLDLVVGVTLTRFDAIYYVHFMCSQKHIYEYPNLGNYTRAFYQLPQVQKCTNITICKQHYYKSHYSIAPNKLIAATNPNADLNLPHNREELFP